jgi:hypothetical protein
MHDMTQRIHTRHASLSTFRAGARARYLGAHAGMSRRYHPLQPYPPTTSPFGGRLPRLPGATACSLFSHDVTAASGCTWPEKMRTGRAPLAGKVRCQRIHLHLEERRATPPARGSTGDGATIVRRSIPVRRPGDGAQSDDSFALSSYAPRSSSEPAQPRQERRQSLDSLLNLLRQELRDEVHAAKRSLRM